MVPLRVLSLVMLFVAAAMCLAAVVVGPAAAAAPSSPTLSWTLYQDSTTNCSYRTPPPRFSVAANGTCFKDTRATCSVDASTGLVTATYLSYFSDGSCNQTYYGTSMDYTIYSWTAVAANTCVPVNVSSSNPNVTTYTEESSVFCAPASQNPDSNAATGKWPWETTSRSLVAVLAATLVLSAVLV